MSAERGTYTARAVGDVAHSPPGGATVTPAAAHDSTQATHPGDGASLLERARAVIRAEARAVAALEDRLGDAFLHAIELICLAPGRVIVSGLGKSGIIGRKLAATLTSTGTPAVFLHPVEGMHGDLGIVGRGDVAILISKSGEQGELNGLVDFFSRLGVRMIALTGRPGSALGRAAQVVLDCSVTEEACPFDLAPTTSTTATLAMADALAVALLVRKGFTRNDFAQLHPGGALGRKLTLRVADVMLAEDYPFLPADAGMRECVVLLAEKRGTVPIVDAERRVIGVVTAGDLTRAMEREENFLELSVSQVMNPRPRVIHADALASAAVYEMEHGGFHGIMALPVVSEDGVLEGIVHLHDLMRAGAV
jgi:arabinose-5-phosphate isomerase